jgi:hypothetical protein
MTPYQLLKVDRPSAARRSYRATRRTEQSLNCCKHSEELKERNVQVFKARKEKYDDFINQLVKSPERRQEQYCRRRYQHMSRFIMITQDVVLF